MSDTPLAGLLVVDLTRHLPGPLVARLLADLGARVVKLEEPEMGDPARQAPPLVRGRSALAATLLAGVESVAADLKRPGGRDLLARLLGRADVLLESFRPGTLARLGFPPEELRRSHSRLVVCSLSGFGQQGPAAGRAGHDLTYQAVAGTLVTPTAMPGVPAADLLGAWSAVAAVLAALLERASRGEGCWIDASLLDGALHGNLVQWAALVGGATAPGDLGGDLPCYNLYRARDGRMVALGLLEPRFWRTFCARTGRRDLRRRQFERSAAARRQVADLIASRSGLEWQALFEAENLPAELVQPAATSREDPRVTARELLGRDADGLPRLGFPARFDGVRPARGGELPVLGADTRRLLAELGSPLAGASRLARRRAGVAPRWSWRSLLWRMASG